MPWSSQIESFVQDYFGDARPQHGSRSIDYYWERKRNLVLELIRRHCRAIELTTPHEPLFVDLGCGGGLDLALIAAFLNQRPSSAVNGNRHGESRWRYVGIDGFPSQLEECRSRFSRQSTRNLSVQAADITARLPLEDASVDVIYCSEVLEHLPDPNGVLSEMSRVVRPQGFALITTPNQPNIFQRSYWSKSRRAFMEAAARAHEKYAEVNGERVRFYGHVTLKPAHLWDVEFAKHGFTVADYYRGAITYGGAGLLSRTPIHQLRMAIERFIDLFPKRMTREISDQVITLYRKTASPT